MNFKHILIFLSDILALAFSLLFILWLKQGPALEILITYKSSLILFAGIWVLVSFLTKKYYAPKGKNAFLKSSLRILITSGIVLGLITSLMFLFRVAYYSRFVVFGTLLTLTITELVFTSIFYAFKNASPGEPVPVLTKYRRVAARKSKRTELISKNKEKHIDPLAIRSRKETILDSIGLEGLNFIERFASIDSNSTLLSSTISFKSFQLLPESKYSAIANLERVNDFRYINKFFESVNYHLPVGGIYINHFESKNQRKKRLLKKFPPVLNYMYYAFDFILKRVFPKFALTKGLYFILTRGNNRVLTKAEAFGRLYSCGFEVLEELETKNLIFFAAVRKKKPLYPEQPTYGPLVKLKRVGKNGKIINVYKLRTMHPYSEFIQDYLYKKEGLKEGGKFEKDFRVTTIGRFFRVLWLDELPMLLNLIKREIKIVGVRPISQHYFNLYPEEMRQRRIQYKPGLVPPFYVDNPKSLNEIIDSEIRYLDAFDKHPVKTDLKYFFKAFYNIVFKRARSA